MLSIVQNLTGKIVEREYVSERLAWCATIDIAVDNFVAGEEEVSDLLFIKHDVYLALIEVVVQEHGDLRDVLLLHGAQSWNRQDS